jgi:hypothetical protein
MGDGLGTSPIAHTPLHIDTVPMLDAATDIRNQQCEAADVHP